VCRQCQTQSLCAVDLGQRVAMLSGACSMDPYPGAGPEQATAYALALAHALECAQPAHSQEQAQSRLQHIPWGVHSPPIPWSRPGAGYSINSGVCTAHTYPGAGPEQAKAYALALTHALGCAQPAHTQEQARSRLQHILWGVHSPPIPWSRPGAGYSICPGLCTVHPRPWSWPWPAAAWPCPLDLLFKKLPQLRSAASPTASCR